MSGLPGPALLRPHRLRLAGGVVCLLLLAASTALYAYLTGPLLQLVLSGGARGADYFRALLPAVAPQRFSVTLVAVLLVALAAVKGVAHLGKVLLLDGTAERVGCALRVRLYGHLLRLPLAVHRNLAAGDLLARIIDDVRRVQEVAVAAPVTLTHELLAALALLVVAVVMAPQLALVAALALPLAALVIALLARLVRGAARQTQAHLGGLAARAARGLAAVREVKSCGAEEREVRLLEEQGHGVLGWSLRHLRAVAIAPLFNEVAAAAALGGTLVWASVRIAEGTLAAERFISFFAAVLLMYKPIKEIGRAAHLVAAGQASVERVAALLREETEERAAGSGLPPLARELRLAGVTFSYGDDRASPAVDGVDLALPVGRIVALAGPSGSGKTTLATLVCGLERPQRGRLVWDGLDLTGRPLEQLRSQAALVPQQPLLLDATVAENIRYGAPEACDEAVRAAARAAGLEARIAALDRGYATMLGPGGVGLSAGETQRLALARALLRDVRLLVLDEPSAALDPDNEARLVETLRALRGQAVLVVAHSVALLAAADEVVRLEAGRVQGTSAPAAVTPPRA